MSQTGNQTGSQSGTPAGAQTHPVRYPDWICVGAQKAATTWLYQQFIGVPGVFLPAIKEIHYYSELCDKRVARYSVRQRERKTTSTRAYWQKVKFAVADRKTKRDRRLAELEHLRSGAFDDNWYGGIFGFAREDEVCGEICPSYMIMPQEGIDHVFRLNPDAKIIIIVRDPVARAWSHLRMTHEPEKLTAIAESDDLDRALRVFVEYTDYASAIPRWRSAAKDGNVRVQLFDDVISDPIATLDGLAEFMGLGQDKKWPRAQQASHKGKPFPMPERIRAALLEKLTPQYEFLAGEFPERVGAWLSKHDPDRAAATTG